MIRKFADRLSVVALGARHHMGIAVALITIIPALAITYLAFVAPAVTFEIPLLKTLIAAILFASVCSGYFLVVKYPINIVRLRRYLEGMVNGNLPEKVTLLQGMDDIPAIERSLTLIVGQLSRQVQRMEHELSRIEWLLSRNVTPTFTRASRSYSKQSPAERGDNTCRLILDSVGKEVLVDIAGDYLDLLETASVIYEQNGDMALHLMSSEWCRYLDQVSRDKKDPTGASRFHSPTPNGRESPWAKAARLSISTGDPVDMEGHDGLSIFCAPIWRGESVIGAIAFAYGDPPRDGAKLAALAEKYGVPEEALRQKANHYETRPAFIVSLAKNRLLISAKLIGEIVDRRQAEEVLRQSEEELRRHRDHLGELVEERTRELKQANEQLQREVEERRRAEHLKDDFVSTVSHELRTPLAITKEGISLLADAIPGPVNERQAKVLHTAGSNIDRLARIINDLLDISKIEAGRMELHHVRLDLTALVRQTAASIEPLARRKDLELRIDLQESPAEIYADPDRLVQVLTNLLGNAVKFTKAGWISVSVRTTNGEVECAVADTGPGLDENDLPRVFDKFTQFGRVDGAGEKGTGLGLAIARNIVELHGGTIGVESQKGGGARFSFRIPRYSDTSVATTVLGEQISAARNEGKALMLYLLRLESDGPSLSEEEWHARRNQVLKRVTMKGFMRGHDRSYPCGSRDALLVAVIAPADMDAARPRWEAQLARLQEEVRKDSPFRLRSGFAAYPQSGQHANDLLKTAEYELAREPKPV